MISTIELNREEAKKQLAEAAMEGNIQRARLMMRCLEDIIDAEGFIDAEEINDFYKVQHWLQELS